MEKCSCIIQVGSIQSHEFLYGNEGVRRAEDKMTEAEVREKRYSKILGIGLEDEGRGHEPRNIGGLQKLEKKEIHTVVFKVSYLQTAYGWLTLSSHLANLDLLIGIFRSFALCYGLSLPLYYLFSVFFLCFSFCFFFLFLQGIT